MEELIKLMPNETPAQRLIELAEFVLERREAIEAGAYEIEIAELEEGTLLELVSFGVSVKQGVRYKLNIDLHPASGAD